MTDLKNVDAILLKIKNQGAMTSNQLASLLDMTNMGARQHLLRLEKQKLVDQFFEKATVGRPKQMWQLTELAHKRFPDRHSDLTLSLIDSVKEIYGDQGLEQLISARENKITQSYKKALSQYQSLIEKTQKLAELRSQEGYMASSELISSNECLLIENHCPICSAAKSCQNFCRSELEIFQQAYGTDYKVSRCEYLFSGDRRCVYKISSNLS